MNSLQSRLFVVAGLTLVTFVFLTGLALDRSFKRTALKAQEEWMRGLVYAFLAEAEVNAQGRWEISDREFLTQELDGSEDKLAAFLLDSEGKLLWSSSAEWTLSHQLRVPVGVGEWRLARVSSMPSEPFALSFGFQVFDELEQGPEFQALILDASGDYDAHLKSFRADIWGWLTGASTLLILVLVLLLRWGLAPLKAMARQISDIRKGEAFSLDGPQPKELLPLGQALNSLLVHEQKQRERHRQALDNLAHSLKTPLAVLRGMEADLNLPPEVKTVLAEQVDRMRTLVDYQLNKAAATGRHALSPPVLILSRVEALVRTLKKAHADKDLKFHIDVPETSCSRIDEGDLLEVLGNVLDNAAKFAKREIWISAKQVQGAVVIAIEDDGPGFSPGAQTRWLSRGGRADAGPAGHGIGLAVVDEVLASYDYSITVESRAQGGARVVLTI